MNDKKKLALNIDDKIWKKLDELIEKIIFIDPNLKYVLKTDVKHDNDGDDDNNYINNKNNEIEIYLKYQYDQYVSAIQLLDCIGAVYSNEDNRGRLKDIERIGPLTIDQYEVLKTAVLASEEIRTYFLRKYNVETLYKAIIASYSFRSTNKAKISPLR